MSAAAAAGGDQTSLDVLRHHRHHRASSMIGCRRGVLSSPECVRLGDRTTPSRPEPVRRDSDDGDGDLACSSRKLDVTLAEGLQWLRAAGMKQEHEDKSGGDGVQQSQVSSSEPGPSILASSVIGPLLLEALDGFLFVVSSTGDIEFVSENVANYLRYSQNDLIGKSIFSIIHVDDQLEFSNCLQPLVERPHSANGDRPINRSSSFSCRLQVKPFDASSEAGSVVRPQVGQYETLQILAILQPCSHDRDVREHSSSSEYSGNQYFLACIARRISVMERLPPVSELEQFFTKQDLHGKILACDTSGFSIDQRTLSAFIGHDIKDFCHVNDISQLAKHHHEVLRVGSNLSGVYRMQLAPGHYVFVQTKSKLFKNSASGMPEFIMSTHSIVRKCDKDSELNGSASNSLMKALIGKSLPTNKNRDDSVKSLDQKPPHAMSCGGALSRGSGLSPNSGLTSCHDFDPDCSNMSDMNDILDILQHQDNASSDLPFDLLSGDCNFDDSLTQEICRQSDNEPHVEGGQRQRTNSSLGQGLDHCGNMSSGTKPERFSNSMLGGNLPYFNGSKLTDDDVTSLLTSLIPAQRHRRQPSFTAPAVTQSSGSTTMSATRTPQLQSRFPHSSSSSLQGVPSVSSPMASRFTASSPMAMPSPLAASTSPRHTANWPPQSTLTGNGARQVPLLEHLRRIKTGATSFGSLQAISSVVASSGNASSGGSSTPSGVGLKDLLLSNDDDDNVGKAETPKPDSRRADSNTVTHSTFDEGRISMSTCDRPDSSTKRSKPAVLLMRLLSRQDDDADDGDVAGSTGDSASASTVSPTTSALSGGTASTPKNFDKSDDAGSVAEGDLERNAPEPSRNNLLRQLLNDDKEESNSTDAGRPLKLLEKLMANEETLSSVVSNSADVTGSTWLPQSSKALRSDKSASRDRFRPRQGERDQLKEQLARLWERDENAPLTSSTTAGVKRKASVVETPADSTDDAVASSSVSINNWKNQGANGGKASKNNILLASLLSTRATTEPVLNTLSISSIATITPQMTLRRSSIDPPDVVVSSLPVASELQGRGALAGSRKMSKTTGSSLSALESLTADKALGCVTSPSVETSSSVGSTSRSTTVTLNPTLADVNISFLGTDNNVEGDDDLNRLLRDVTPMEVDPLGIGDGSETLVDDSALLSQLERILSSPSMNLMELDHLITSAGIDQLRTGPDQAAINAIQDQLMKMESPLPASQTHVPQHSRSRAGGSGLLGQLLNNGCDQFSDVAVETSTASEVFPQRRSAFNTPTVPPMHGFTAASSNSTGNPNNVAALVQQAAAKAATRSGSQLESSPAERPSSIQLGRPGHQSASYVSQHDRPFDVDPMTNLNELLNVSFAPNVSLPRSQRSAIASSSGTGPSLGQPSSRVASMPSSPFASPQPLPSASAQPVPSPAQQPDEWSQRLSTAIMAGGAVVQGNPSNVSSNTGHSALNVYETNQFGVHAPLPGKNRLSHSSGSRQSTLQSPSFSSDMMSPRSSSSRGSHGLPSPFASVQPKLTQSSQLMSPAISSTARSGTSSSFTVQSSMMSPMADDKLSNDSFQQKVSSPSSVTNDGGMRGPSQAALASRRGSCSLEVMQGLRAKCHARFQSNQQQNVGDASVLSPAPLGSSTECSELPPDILQSLSELNDAKVEHAATDDNQLLDSSGVPELNGSSLDDFLASWGDMPSLDLGGLDLPSDPGLAHSKQLEQNTCQLDNSSVHRQLPAYGCEQNMVPDQQHMCPQLPQQSAANQHRRDPTNGWPQHQFDPELRMDGASCNNAGTRGIPSQQIDFIHQQQQFDIGMRHSSASGMMRSSGGLHGHGGPSMPGRSMSQHPDMQYGMMCPPEGMMHGQMGAMPNMSGVMPGEQSVMMQNHNSMGMGMMQGQHGMMQGQPGMMPNESLGVMPNQLQNLQVMVANQSNMMRGGQHGSMPSHSRSVHGQSSGGMMQGQVGAMHGPSGMTQGHRGMTDPGLMLGQSASGQGHRGMVQNDMGAMHGQGMPGAGHRSMMQNDAGLMHGHGQLPMMQGMSGRSGVMMNQSSMMQGHMGAFQHQSGVMSNQASAMGSPHHSMIGNQLGMSGNGSGKMGPAGMGMMSHSAGLMQNQPAMQQRPMDKHTHMGMMHRQLDMKQNQMNMMQGQPTMLPGQTSMNPKQLQLRMQQHQQQQQQQQQMGGSMQGQLMPGNGMLQGQMAPDMKDSHLDSSFNWLNSPQGMSPGFSQVVHSSPKAGSQASSAQMAPNGGLPVGMQPSPNGEMAMAAPSPSARNTVKLSDGDEFLRGQFLSPFPEDGFRGRQQMPQMNSTDGFAQDSRNRLTHVFRRQPSATGGMPPSASATGTPGSGMNSCASPLTSLSQVCNSGGLQHGSNSAWVSSTVTPDNGIRQKDYSTGLPASAGDGMPAVFRGEQLAQHQPGMLPGANGGPHNRTGSSNQSFFGHSTSTTSDSGDTSALGAVLASSTEDRKPPENNRGSTGSLLQQLLSD